MSDTAQIKAPTVKETVSKKDNKENKVPKIKKPLPKITPKVDLRENEDKFFISIELPGIKSKDISLKCNSKSIMIEAKKKGPKSIKHETNQKVELEYGIFERTIDLPKTVNPKKAEAKLRNGLFTLEIPKKDYLEFLPIKVK